MRHATRIHATRIGLAASLLAGLAINANADAVTDWNIKAGEFIVEAKLGTPPANRVMAIVHTAVYEAANAITKRYPASRLQLEAAQGASLDAAVAAANHATLVKLAAVATGGHRRGLPGGAGDDRRRPGEDRRHRRRAEGRGGRPRVARR